MRKRFDGIPQMEMEKLIKYNWPGNVRELENIIERSVILSDGTFKVPELDSGQPDQNAREGIIPTLRESERLAIITALNKTGWKVRGRGGASELLNINPSTLFFRMRKLGIRRPDSFPVKRQ
jgi:transcriptional regulator of acetoin/glycerol metabolism